MDLLTLTQYYSDLLAYEYRGRSRASQQVKLLTKQALGDLLADLIQNAFNIDTEVGVQLDVIGKYVGVPRNIGSVLPKPYFGLWTYTSLLDPTKYQGTWNPNTDTPTIPAAAGGNAGNWYVVYASGSSTAPIADSWIAGDVIYSDGANWVHSTADNGNGLTDYTNLSINANGIFYSYNYATGQNSNLTDEQYRTVIKLKILLNSNDGTLATIMQYLWTFFGPSISLIDNQDMTMAYAVYSTVPLSKELLEVYLPRPMGVGITVTIITPPTPGGGARITTEGGSEITTEGGDHITS